VLRRPPIVALLLAAALLSACGHKVDRITHGDTEGAYLDVGPLKYQVQISRQLNPSNVEDKTFLSGLTPADRALPRDTVWFAVFIRVENESGHTQNPAQVFSITDTQDNVFKPVPLASSNAFAYRAQPMPDKTLIPPVDSVASDSNIQGSLLVFKIPRVSLANRPLELKVTSPDNESGTVDLDV
jgi:hypothetical protein